MDYKARWKMYDEFCLYLNSLGIPAVSTEYYDTNYVSIYVQRISDVQDSKVIAERLNQEVISHFKSLLKVYNFKGDYNKYEWNSSSVTNIYSKDARYIDLLVRSSKMEIIEQINASIASEFCPKYIFSHSSNYEHGYNPAGYSIIFGNETLLRESEDNIQNQIIDICNEILEKNDVENKYESKYLKVEFYDSNNCNLYGMSRED